MLTSSPFTLFIAGLRGGMNRIDWDDTRPKYWYMEETRISQMMQEGPGK